MFSEFLILSAVKLLFIPAYRSTDFEVHRNWLAVTKSTNISQWYYEETSEWTLDYPPMFAYFEYLLSFVAELFDPEMLNVENLNYASTKTVIFQRLSVIVVDIFYFFGVRECLKSASKDVAGKYLHGLLLLTNIGLIFVDHIHFQYNGILFGILLLSCGKIFQRKFIQSAFYFALLLNMKHIFIYMAPVYFCYLLRHFCLGSIKDFVKNVIKLGSVVLLVTSISFGPFIKHLPQVMSRLFPFKRGLTHAYWAPNFWALYNFVDKVLTVFMKIPQETSSTSGLVQEVKHNVLPAVPPAASFAILLLAILPCCIKIFLVKSDSPQNFMKPLIICAASSFMFGWHVHEKAVLMILIPLQVLTFHKKSEASSSLFTAIFGLYSLTPLLFTSELVLVKLSLFVAYIAFNLFVLASESNIQMSFVENVYSCGIIILPLYEHLIQYLLNFHVKLPFLPLMLTSVYCSIGMIYFWIKFYCEYLLYDSDQNVKKKSK